MKPEIYNELTSNMKELEEKLVNFVREETAKRGFKKVILGLSGGIDSALVAFIAAKAIGPENVYTVMMPYKTSSKESVEHAELVVKASGINSKKVEITPMVDEYFGMEGEASGLRRGNYMSRTRMCVLFDNSAKENAIVMGTSNKTELLLGYGTQFGDMASGINPIGELLKVQVWELSRYMGVPKEVIDKKPSADLWEGQTDEAELGFSYEMADEILYHLIYLNNTKEEIKAKGYDEKIVDTIFTRIARNQYKREMPTIAKIR